MPDVKIHIEDELCTDNVLQFAKEANLCTDLYSKKNRDYGNSFENGINIIGDSYALGKIYDKTNRLLSINKNNKSNFESVEDTLIDLACYSIMYLMHLRNNK